MLSLLKVHSPKHATNGHKLHELLVVTQKAERDMIAQSLARRPSAARAVGGVQIRW